MFEMWGRGNVCVRVVRIGFTSRLRYAMFEMWCLGNPYWPYTGRKIRRATPPRRGCGKDTFSDNRTEFVGKLLHEGGVWRRTFFGFSQYQNGQ